MPEIRPGSKTILSTPISPGYKELKAISDGNQFICPLDYALLGLPWYLKAILFEQEAAKKVFPNNNFLDYLLSKNKNNKNDAPSCY